MDVIGISIDYSNICKDFNTAYLDRDNTDRATKKCMNEILSWTKEFITELSDNFGYKIYKFNSHGSVEIDEIASKRFLFYSLEKEITLQKYLIQKEYTEFENLTAWADENEESILVQNDENGGGIYFYLHENSKVHQWIIEKLQNFTLDEIPFHP